MSQILIQDGNEIAHMVADALERLTEQPQEVIIVACPTSGGFPQIMATVRPKEALSLLSHCLANGCVIVSGEQESTPKKGI